MNDRKANIKDKTTKIDEIIEYFEGEEIDLDSAIEKYEEASKLVAGIEAVLKEYETKIEKIKTREEQV